MIRLSTIHFYIILKHTLGSIIESFEYHTFLHHSQTLTACNRSSLSTIHFYIILKLPISNLQNLFEYHTFLHHSQTCIIVL